jgi:hypothetical protein
MPELGWKVDAVCADQVDDIDVQKHMSWEHIARRARLMSRMRSILRPAFNLAGIQPPQQSLVVDRCVERSPSERDSVSCPDVVVATAPPMVALLAARLGLIGSDVPFVADMRDLWAGNPAFDRGGPLLPWIERWIFARAELRHRMRRRVPGEHSAGGIRPLKDRFRLITKRLRAGARRVAFVRRLGLTVRSRSCTQVC